MNEKEAWERAIELIPNYGRLLELRKRDGAWMGCYTREDTMPYWVLVAAAL